MFADGVCKMPVHELLNPGIPGRRPRIQRLVLHPSGAGDAGGKRSWGTQEWAAIKERLRLTVRRAPEVVINVKGSRRSRDDDRTAIAGVLRYMMYISRNGQLPVFDERGDRIQGRDAVRDVHASWDLDMQRMRGTRDEGLHPSFNMIFSMPAKTDPDRMLDAVKAFAQEHFQGHQYVMAVHTHETDPASDAPAHPHVHLVVRAEDENGLRMHVRKSDLRAWREDFAAQLRSRGIEANATSRAERGRSFKALRGAEWHIQKRYEGDRKAGRSTRPPKARAARFHDAAEELVKGHAVAKPWEVAMAARRRDVLRELKQNAARLRAEGSIDLAVEVEQFIQDMPPVDSERRKIQRALIEQVKLRLREHEQDRPDERSR